MQLSPSGVASLLCHRRSARFVCAFTSGRVNTADTLIRGILGNEFGRVYRFNSALSARKFAFLSFSLSLSLSFSLVSRRRGAVSLRWLLLVARWLRATVQINTLDRYARGVSLRSAYVLTNARPVCRPVAIVAKSSRQFPDERKESEREREGGERENARASSVIL